VLRGLDRVMGGLNDDCAVCWVDYFFLLPKIPSYEFVEIQPYFVSANMM
jgi:hypothetical protein